MKFLDFFIPVFVVALIVTVIVLLCVTLSPDKIIYEFTNGDEVVTFEVSSLSRRTDHYYVFILEDGTYLTYYPEPGSIVRRTEIRY